MGPLHIETNYNLYLLYFEVGIGSRFPSSGSERAVVRLLISVHCIVMSYLSRMKTQGPPIFIQTIQSDPVSFVKLVWVLGSRRLPPRYVNANVLIHDWATRVL